MRTAFLLVALFALQALCAPASQQILSLPGLKDKLSFNQYSGYIAVNSESNLFYWLVESQSSPSTDPLILWLQGGPGCSGLFGLLYENGPFLLHPDNSLVLNPYSWNLNANVLYLESPVGVGYSYSTSPLYNTDNTTADNSYTFLKAFFAQYPEFQSNEFYIMGESYGGHYVPQLASVILRNNPTATIKINLQGIMVGNPWSDSFYDNAAVPPFIYYHSLCSLPTYEMVVQYCIDNSFAAMALEQPFHENVPNRLVGLFDECDQALDMMYEEMGPINNYDIYTPCTDGLLPNCTNNSMINDYFDRKDVQAAIHAKNVQPWLQCGNVNYTGSWNSVLSLYPALMDAIHVTLYSGDITFNVP
jgi:carboxypeptidase C (cathepsin A)